ncbi:MAG: FMN-binding negative transcriptional regulator [Armatimonadetes bacterium]|nr:FMN-binding negative transcriptional regulator [Armatimonadota bacterium]
MYPLPEFQENDRQAIVDFIRRHPLAMVTGVDVAGKVVATHVPVLVRDDGENLRFNGHMMRKTDHWDACKANSEVLVVFTGPDAPVPASWYADTANGGTWNYSAVHARGTLEFVPQDKLVDILRELKDHYEDVPEARFDSLPRDYVANLAPAIEGFHIHIRELKAVFKLSQNKDDMDFESVVTKLAMRGGESAQLAEEMRSQRTRMQAAAK